MSLSLFYTRDGQHFWYCSDCRTEYSEPEETGLCRVDEPIHVRVGNDIVACVCSKCFSTATKQISALFGANALPDVDERGALLNSRTHVLAAFNNPIARAIRAEPKCFTCMFPTSDCRCSQQPLL